MRSFVCFRIGRANAASSASGWVGWVGYRRGLVGQLIQDLKHCTLESLTHSNTFKMGIFTDEASNVQVQAYFPGNVARKSIAFLAVPIQGQKSLMSSRFFPLAQK